MLLFMPITTIGKNQPPSDSFGFFFLFLFQVLYLQLHYTSVFLLFSLPLKVVAKQALFVSSYLSLSFFFFNAVCDKFIQRPNLFRTAITHLKLAKLCQKGYQNHISYQALVEFKLKCMQLRSNVRHFHNVFLPLNPIECRLVKSLPISFRF